MSYCRWSSGNFRSDVYVYADCSGGWTTHIAVNRKVGPRIPEPSLRFMCGKSIQRLRFLVYRLWRRLWDLNYSVLPRMTIRLPFAGETFNDDTPGDCADRLIRLRSIGYVVPRRAIDRLQEEHREEFAA